MVSTLISFLGRRVRRELRLRSLAWAGMNYLQDTPVLTEFRAWSVLSHSGVIFPNDCSYISRAPSISSSPIRIRRESSPYWQRRMVTCCILISYLACSSLLHSATCFVGTKSPTQSREPKRRSYKISDTVLLS